MTSIEAIGDAIKDRFISKRKYTERREVAFDPLTAIAITSMVIDICKAIKSCKKTPEEAVSAVRRPGVMDRVYLRRIVRKHLGTRKFLLYGPDLMEAVMSQGKAVSTDDIKGIYNNI